ncbi:MAG: aminotransferase class I/II-fold pyridoxal phosphate-dependent enzyme [bacterium]
MNKIIAKQNHFNETFAGDHYAPPDFGNIEASQFVERMFQEYSYSEIEKFFQSIKIIIGKAFAGTLEIADQYQGDCYQALIELLQKVDHDDNLVNPENSVVTFGSTTSINLLTALKIGKEIMHGNAVLVADSSYLFTRIAGIIEEHGINRIPVKSGFSGFPKIADLDQELKKAEGRRLTPFALAISIPSEITGEIPTVDEIDEYLNFAKTNNLVLIIDACRLANAVAVTKLSLLQFLKRFHFNHADIVAFSSTKQGIFSETLVFNEIFLQKFAKQKKDFLKKILYPLEKALQEFLMELILKMLYGHFSHFLPPESKVNYQ